jgi:hypothetical protein
MRLGIIGGLDRKQALYGRIAASYGFDADFHDGKMSGPASRSLENLVDRCDLVVIVTGVNSHTAVQVARRRLRDRGRAPVLMRSCGIERFAALLASLAERSTLSAQAGLGPAFPANEPYSVGDAAHGHGGACRSPANHSRVPTALAASKRPGAGLVP